MLQKCLECTETVPVGPRRSWKLLEGHGRFHKVPSSTTHCPAPLALGVKPPRLPWPARWWGRTKGGGNPPPGGITKSNIWKVSGGKVWEGLEGLGVQVGLPTPLGRCPRPLGHLYKVSQGGRDTQVPGAPSPLVASCSTIRPRFRALI